MREALIDSIVFSEPAAFTVALAIVLASYNENLRSICTNC